MKAEGPDRNMGEVYIVKYRADTGIGSWSGEDSAHLDRREADDRAEELKGDHSAAWVQTIQLIDRFRYSHRNGENEPPTIVGYYWVEEEGYLTMEYSPAPLPGERTGARYYGPIPEPSIC